MRSAWATLDWTRRAVGAYRRRQIMPRRFHTLDVWRIDGVLFGCQPNRYFRSFRWCFNAGKTLMVACTARGHSMLRLQQQHRDAAVRVALSRMAVQPAGGPLAVKKHYKQAGTISDVNAIISEICLAGAGEPCDFNRALVLA